MTDLHDLHNDLIVAAGRDHDLSAQELAQYALRPDADPALHQAALDYIQQPRPRLSELDGIMIQVNLAGGFGDHLRVLDTYPPDSIRVLDTRYEQDFGAQLLALAPQRVVTPAR